MDQELWQIHFPEAMFIIDLYHARQHVSELCKTLFARNEKKIETSAHSLVDGLR